MGHIVQSRSVNAYLFHGIGPTIGTCIDISSMVSKDASEIGFAYEIEGSFVPRFATVQSPMKFLSATDEDSVVR